LLANAAGRFALAPAVRVRRVPFHDRIVTTDSDRNTPAQKRYRPFEMVVVIGIADQNHGQMEPSFVAGRVITDDFVTVGLDNPGALGYLNGGDLSGPDKLAGGWTCPDSSWRSRIDLW
jgi:hypothetical protein